MQPLLKAVTTCVLGLVLSGCSLVYDQQYVEWETKTPDQFPVLTAVGYAPLQKQQNMDAAGKKLAAMRASKLDAYRELAEQVYGQRISGSTAVADWMVQDDRYQASVDGVIRGAEVVRSYAAGDYYVTELKLDFQQVHRLYTSVSRPQELKRVVYY
ncbi:MAG: LPP20 family lipoprotein [Idiomarina sp.]